METFKTSNTNIKRIKYFRIIMKYLLVVITSIIGFVLIQFFFSLENIIFLDFVSRTFSFVKTPTFKTVSAILTPVLPVAAILITIGKVYNQASFQNFVTTAVNATFTQYISEELRNQIVVEMKEKIRNELLHNEFYSLSKEAQKLDYKEAFNQIVTMRNDLAKEQRQIVSHFQNKDEWKDKGSFCNYISNTRISDFLEKNSEILSLTAKHYKQLSHYNYIKYCYENSPYYYSFPDTYCFLKVIYVSFHFFKNLLIFADKLNSNNDKAKKIIEVVERHDYEFLIRFFTSQSYIVTESCSEEEEDPDKPSSLYNLIVPRKD